MSPIKEPDKLETGAGWWARWRWAGYDGLIVPPIGRVMVEPFKADCDSGLLVTARMDRPVS